MKPRSLTITSRRTGEVQEKRKSSYMDTQLPIQRLRKTKRSTGAVGTSSEGHLSVPHFFAHSLPHYKDTVFVTIRQIYSVNQC